MKRKRSETVQQTSYEKQVKTPSPYSIQGSDINVLGSYIPSDYKFKGKEEDKYYWKSALEYNKTTLWGIRYIIDKYTSVGAAFLPYTFISTDSGIKAETSTYWFNSGVSVSLEIACDALKDMMKNSKIKIIFIFTKTFDKYDIHGKDHKTVSGHGNWTIIDKVRKQVEFFDPHGNFEFKKMAPRWAADWCKEFVDIFQIKSSKQGQFECIPRNYKMKTYVETCPAFGFQYYEIAGFEYSFDISGYCVLWCIFMLDLRLQHVHLDIRVIQDNLIQKTRSDFIKRTKTMVNIDERLGNHFKHFIRQYGLYLRDQQFDERELMLMSADPYSWLNK